MKERDRTEDALPILAAAASGQKRNQMNRTSEEKFDIREEIKLIPKVAVLVAVLLIVAWEALLFLVLFPHEKHPAPALPIQILVGLLSGSVLAFFILLVVYVNRDAKRRGMNSTLWTVLVLLVPDAIGFIIYFVVRQPVMARCPQCGATVTPSFNYCPKCRSALHPVCPKCHRAIRAGDTFCPYCASELKASA